MSREYLAGVFRDTQQKVESGKYNAILKSEKFFLSTSNVSYFEYSDNVSVVNEDCVNVTQKLSRLGKTCLLNMASYKRPGGGVVNGAIAQEEELCRRSNLMWGLPPEYYPLAQNEFIYTLDVDFFKDDQYQEMSPFRCDVITMAAVNLNGLVKPQNYEQLMKDKIDNMLRVPIRMGCKNLVLSAFGCGVFRNNPEFVASLFNESLYKFGTLYDKIQFAILNDRNSVGSNFDIFKEILEENRELPLIS